MPNDRIQKEVEELLAKLERFPPRKPLSRRITDAISAPFRAIGGWISGLHLPSISAGHVLLASVILIIFAWVALDSSSLQTWLLAAGIILFIGAFVYSLRRNSPGTSEKYWRDRPLDLRSGRSQRSWWDRWRNRR